MTEEQAREILRHLPYTLEMFDSLRCHQDSYNDVQRIAGSAGQLVADNGTTSTRVWKNTDGSSMTLIFRDGILRARSQTRLPSESPEVQQARNILESAEKRKQEEKQAEKARRQEADKAAEEARKMLDRLNK
jgi:hypothetical protein